MDKTLFEALKQGLKEVVVIRRSELVPGRVTEISLPDESKKWLRAKS